MAAAQVDPPAQRTSRSTTTLIKGLGNAFSCIVILQNLLHTIPYTSEPKLYCIRN